ncbi:MAG: hypothetical protein HYR56_13805 [Acidobacteria bacterium]|nr:hypothetical protein [Acidobacteriota bacterium]MBI3423976.1 hypothetical protein [Acidobacteriota bacterium]
MCSLLTMLAGSGFGQTVGLRKVFGRYQQLVWHDQHGLPENSVMAITQTRDQYLWVATVEGVARFDGVHFTVFDRNNTPALKHNHVLSLHEDRQGDLWLGTNGGGVTRYHAGQFSNYGVADGLTDGRVWALLDDRAGNLWLGTEGGGLNRFRDGRFSVFNMQNGLPDNRIWALVEDREGALWIGTRGGLARFKDERFTSWTTKDGLPNDFVRALCLDRDGSLWVGTDGGGMARFSEGRFTVYDMKSGLTSNSVFSIRQDQMEDQLWIGTLGGGVLRFRHGNFTPYTTAEGLPSDRVNVLYQSRGGDLWVGLSGFGLCQIRVGRVGVVTAEDGLIHDYIRPIIEDATGSLWVGTVEGLTRIKAGKFTSWTTKDGLPNNYINALREDRDGALWIGTRGGLACFKAEHFTVWTTKEGLPENNLRSIVTDHAGDVWIGTYGGGLARLRDGQFTTLTARDGLPNNTVEALCVDRADNLWIGTWGGGLSRYHKGRFTTWTTQDGLASNHIYALFEAADGALWIGTGGGGLSRFKDGKFANVAVKNGLYDDLTYNIMVDDLGDMWLNGNKGLSRVSWQELNDFCDGRRTSVTSYSFDTADGMLSREGNRAQPAGWKSRDGRLWFPTLKGVAVIDPRIREKQPPQINIEAVKLAGQKFSVGSLLRIEPGQEGLEIQYTGLDWGRPQQVSFKYQMVGLEQNWIGAGTRRTAYYSYLPPGEYTFRVIASNGDGVWNTEGRSLRVVVLPPFYRTWWFRALVALSLAGVIGLLFKRRLERANRARRAQEEFSRRLIDSQEQERKRIAAELHDSLGQNLLVIKNYALMGLNAANGGNPLREHLDEISEAASQSLAEVRQISHNLRPYQLERLGLTNTLQTMLRQVANASDIGFSSEVEPLDGLFAPEDEISIYRIVQEALNNILKHSDAQEASVFIKHMDGEIQITITDDGRGFTVEPASRAEMQQRGLGLTGTAERVRILGGKLSIHSAPGQGTTLHITLKPNTHGSTN